MPLSNEPASGEALPETPEDSRFLLDIPEDFDYGQAELRIQGCLQRVMDSSRQAINAELVSIIKIALGLEGTSGQSVATRVILNVIAESKAICGFESPELLIASLRKRRERVKELLAQSDGAE